MPTFLAGLGEGSGILAKTSVVRGVGCLLRKKGEGVVGVLSNWMKTEV